MQLFLDMADTLSCKIEMGFSVNELHLCERSVTNVAALNGAFILQTESRWQCWKRAVAMPSASTALETGLQLTRPALMYIFFLLSFAYAK